MKRVFLLFMLSLFFIFPFQVKAISNEEAEKKMNNYMRKALKKEGWKVFEGRNSGYVQIKVKIGTTSSSEFNKVYKMIKKVSAVVVGGNGNVVFGELETDGNKVYMVADEWPEAEMNNVLASDSWTCQFVSYSNTSSQKSAEIKIKNPKIELDTSNITAPKGSEINPDVVGTSGSITVPSKDADFWKYYSSGKPKCYYFKIDMSSKNITYARYKITPEKLVNEHLFFGNDTWADLSQTVQGDAKDKGLFCVSSKNYYALCNFLGSDIYGKTFTFEYTDETSCNTATSMQDQNASSQVGKENTQTVDPFPTQPPYEIYEEDINKLYDSTWSKKDGCAVLNNGKTIEVLKEILNYLRIAAVALLLILGSLDFAGAIMSDKDDAMKSAGNKFKKRLIATVIVFLVPALVNIVLFIADKNESICGLLS